MVKLNKSKRRKTVFFATVEDNPLLIYQNRRLIAIL